jgi:hypothetical protein
MEWRGRNKLNSKVKMFYLEVEIVHEAIEARIFDERQYFLD